MHRWFNSPAAPPPSLDTGFYGHAAAGIDGRGCGVRTEDFDSFDGADICFYSENNRRLYYRDQMGVGGP